MLATPDTSNVSFNNVYEPSEDSYLLLDTLASQSAYLTDRFEDSPPMILEVGSGSGVVLSFVAMHAQHIFGRPDVLTMGIDVNQYACVATQESVRKNCRPGYAGFLGCVRGDLVSCVRRRAVDVLIFNPPYVPSETVPAVLRIHTSSCSTSQMDGDMLAMATDGGNMGMEVTDRLLGQLPDLLSEGGVAYILLCAQNKPEDVKANVQSWGKEWSVETVGRSGAQGGWERLQIIRIARLVVPG